MNRSIVIAAGTVSGAVLLVVLLLQHDLYALASVLSSAGVALILVGLVHVAPLTAHSFAWRYLLPPKPPLSVRTVARARWMAESLNDLLPVAQIGGNLARAALITRAGVRGVDAGASVLSDITVNQLAQLAFALGGALLLFRRLSAPEMMAPALLGIGLLTAAVAGFYLLQRRGGIGALARLIAHVGQTPRWSVLTANVAALDDAVGRIYGTRTVLWPAVAWHAVAWLLEAGELWLVLRVLDHPLSVESVVIWECLGAALRAAAFIVPAALGVQEAGYVVLGRLFGVSPEIALAAAVARRMREVLFGVPGVLLWYIEESAAWVTRRDAVRARRER